MKAPAAGLQKAQANQDDFAMRLRRGTPLYEQIYDTLWNLIFSGDVPPGQRLSDREWATRLRTSRTPVREAMRQMARDGILLTLENGGYQMRAADPQGLANLYRCRAPLAALAVHDTTCNGNDRLFAQIKSVVDSTGGAIAKSDAAAALRYNSKFHRLIVENSGNPYLIITMTNLEKLILFYRVSLLGSVIDDRAGREAYFKHLERGNRRHSAIVSAMMRRKPDEASRLMSQHLMTSAEDMAQLLQSHTE